MPKVDVIIPAYNAAKYLAIALDSVLAQTFEDWRIILVDDGSTDDTATVVAPYIEQLGSRLKFIQQTNRGLPVARNVAIRASTSEYIALLDADDMWLPCRLQASLKSFEGRPLVGLSYGCNARIGPDGAVIDTFDRRQKHGEGWIAPYIYMRLIDLPCPTTTFRRRCIEEVGLFDESMRATEDRDLWLRIALRYEVAFIHKVIAHYRMSPGSMTNDIERMLQAQRQFIEKHYGAPGCGWLARRIALGRCYKQHAEALAHRRQLRAALFNSMRAVALYPLSVGNFRTSGSLFIRWFHSLVRR
jgi:glycosyltransferase involved in cell wall biosynthesis